MPSTHSRSPAACAPAKPFIPPGAACPSRWSAKRSRAKASRRSTLDMQHGMWDDASALQAVAQIHLAGAAPIVRVPLWQNSLVSRMLDLGAEGIIAPMINGEAEARAFVQVAKYPPVGERSIGAHRAGDARRRAGPEALYRRRQCRRRITFAMIETRRRSTISTRSRRCPASTCCSSAPPTCPAACRTAPRWIRIRPRSKRRWRRC